ncbi:MAG: branched chain amino acid--2-keto-4-methylthiobutyrate aminotransferase [Isosphaeraceae bacterium]
MIWVDGRVVPDDALSLGIRDRAFEHGLGLFETLRTWHGRATLLSRHLARLERSARTLGIPIDRRTLPDQNGASELLAAENGNGDTLLRITTSGGGPSGSSPAIVWMRTGALPPTIDRAGAVVGIAEYQVSWDDPLARHKTLNYWARRLAAERAYDLGADEALIGSPDGRVWEGTRMNLFLIRGRPVTTAGLDAPIVPGIMRAIVLEMAVAAGLSVRETAPTLREIDQADEVFLTNAVRGIVPVGRAPGRVLNAPGPWTTLLRDRLADWIRDSNEKHSG